MADLYKKISEMGVSASLTDNSLIPFVKPGDSNNYIVTYKSLSDSILDEIDFDPEIYKTVIGYNSTFYDKGFNMNAGDPGVNFIEITKLD